MEREADTILGPIPLMSPPFGCHYPTFLTPFILLSIFAAILLVFKILEKNEKRKFGKTSFCLKRWESNCSIFPLFFGMTEMQKAASMASALVLFFPPAVLIFRLFTRKMSLF